MPVYRQLWLIVLTVATLSVACGNGDSPMATGEVPITDSATNASAAAPITTPTPPAAPPTSSAITTTTAPPEPVFSSAARAATAEDLGESWQQACPVPIESLRVLDLSHWDDNGEAANGELVVHVDHAEGVVSVFERLFVARFPVHSMRPITAFGGDDDASMTANNTSAFNCREIDGRPGVWSQHAYGGAIDINPLVNPWVRGDRVVPPSGAVYVDRDPSVPGLVVAGDVVTQAFAEIGWGWGGDWSDTLDYQHFSHNGR